MKLNVIIVSSYHEEDEVEWHTWKEEDVYDHHFDSCSGSTSDLLLFLLLLEEAHFEER